MKKLFQALGIFILLMVAVTWWWGRDARAAHDAVKVGMLAEDAVFAAKDSLLITAYALSPPAQAPSEETGFIVYKENNRAVSRSAGKTILMDELMKKIDSEWRLTFHFVGMPRRSYFRAIVGRDGRIREITDINSAD